MQVIKAFQRDRPGAILLMSTRSAAISTVMGIEVAASHVFITEPSLSPALEERALACGLLAPTNAGPSQCTGCLWR